MICLTQYYFTHTLPRNNLRFHNLSRQQRCLEHNKCDIAHRNVRSICLHVEITMTVSYKQDLAFRQMSTYVRRIAMMHRRNGRKTDIPTARKKSHASSINHTTKTKSKCHRSILSSHAARSFFFWIVVYHAPRKARGKRKLQVPAVEKTRCRKLPTTVRTRFRSHKILLRAQSRSN